MATDTHSHPQAVVLLSGGLDSLVAAHLATSHADLRLAITCDYGQRAAVPEINAAARQAARLGIPHHVIALPWLGSLSSAAITDQAADIPHPDVSQLDEPSAAAATAARVWVPNRNAILVMIAAACAEALGCSSIIAGFNAEEAATFPDNSPEFIAAANALLAHSTANHPTTLCPTMLCPTMLCPTIAMTKTEIIQTATEHAICLDTIYSCYEAGPRHCLQCESCLRLQRALRQAGLWQEIAPSL